MSDERTAATVEELISILREYPGDTPIEFQSTDAPEYGWLEIGPELGEYGTDRYGHRNSFRYGIAQIGNPK